MGRREEREDAVFCLFHFLFFENAMHLLAQFVAKEMMNSIASSLRFQGRKGRKMLSRTPGGKGLASSGFTSFSLVMIWETEKNITCQRHWSCAIGEAPTGHTEGSNRGNSEILANFSQDSCNKIILVRTWGRRQGEAGEGTSLSVHCSSGTEKPTLPQRAKTTVGEIEEAVPQKWRKSNPLLLPPLQPARAHLEDDLL